MSSEIQSETESQPRLLRGLDVSVTISALIFWGIVLGWSYTQGMSRVRYGVIFIGAILSVYAIDQTRQAIENSDRVDAAVLLSASIILITASIYFALNFERVYVQQQGYALEHEYMLARLIILSILYLTWREFGNLFLGLVSGVIIYGLYGYHVPGILNHSGMTQLTLLQSLVTDLYGFYGSLTQLTAAWIAPFLLYAGLLFGYGAFDLILRIAIQSAKYIESGVAQTAVLASAVIGSINGSYAANAAMTGSFTIPTMKDSGMKGFRAAAIEAVASTSGQVLPPVMGASAFVMASYLGVAYVDILTAGLVPAAILVICIVIAVHYLAISDMSNQEMEFSEFFEDELTDRQKLFEAIRFGIPFIVLIYLLGIAQWTVMTSAMWTIVTMVILGTGIPPIQRIFDESEISPQSEFIVQFWKTISGFRRGALILAPIAIVLAAVNGVIDIFSVTGVPNKIALLLIELSGGVLLYAVLLAMAVSIVMGIGMPTVAAYVIVAILIAPTLIADFGVPAITAHYTVFYAAILAGITPPVAIAAVITAGIAEANFWRVCGASIKIAAPLFILPIAFVYNPAVVSMSINSTTLTTGLLVLLGGITMIYGLNYPFEMLPSRRMGMRFSLIVLGVFVMIYPGGLVKAFGSMIFIVIFITEKIFTRGLKLPFLQEVSR